MITALFIDIDNTILDFGKCSRQSVKDGFRDFGLKYNEGVMDVFHKVNDRLWLKIEDGTLTREGLHEIRWKTVFQELGIEADGVAFEKQFVSNLHESSEPVDGAYEFLEYLSNKYTLCAASNGPYEQQCHRLKKAEMLKYFSHVFVSEDIGVSKPDIKFFTECQKRLGGISKEKLMLIGDSPTADIKGGRDFGIRTCWFNIKGSNENVLCDYVINSLSEIKNIL